MAARLTNLLLAVAVFLQAAPPSLSQDCPPPAAPVLNDTELLALQGCTVITGSLFIGYADCSRVCTITSLAPLSSLRTVGGSFAIQCCNTLTEISGLPSLRQIDDTFVVRSNKRLRGITASSQFSSIRNIDISQNQILQSVTSFSSLITLGGYLLINRNPILTDISGFRNLVRISGRQESGQALSILYNIGLTDLSGLRGLRAVGFGAVRIEGNAQLCYAGHPVWRYGSYPPRPSQGDQGVDWRTALSSAPLWQYTWNVDGVPTLVIQNNGNATQCRTTQCHSSCSPGIGCWGPGVGMCGLSCFVQSSTNSCVTATTTTPPEMPPSDCSWWPPTQQPFSTIFGIFFAIIALIVLAVIVAAIVVGVKLRRKCGDGRKGSFDVHLQNESQFELVSHEKQYNSPAHKTDRSNIIASSSVSNGGTPREKQRPKFEDVVVLKNRSVEEATEIESVATPEKKQVVNFEEVEEEEMRQKETDKKERMKKEDKKKKQIEEEKKKMEEEKKKKQLEEEKRKEEEKKKKEEEKRRKAEEERIRLEKEKKQKEEDFDQEEESDEEKENEEEENEEEEDKKKVDEEEEEEEKEEEKEEEEQEEDEDEEEEEEEEEETDHRSVIWEDLQTLAVPATQIELASKLGKGTIGKAIIDVYEARLNNSSQDNLVVVKQLQRDASLEDQEIFLQPATAMSKLRHDNVLSLLGVSLDSNPLMIVLEYCGNGNLKSYLLKRRSQAQEMMVDGTVLGIICDMAAGLNYLNSLEVAHNDFAARSCLVTNANAVKVGDYGLSRETFKNDYYARKEGQMAWPVRWMAPEMILDREDHVLDSMQVSLTANVWSFGIAMWEVCTFAKQPYESMGEEEIIQELKATGKCHLNSPFSNADYLAPLFGIMSRCWKLAQERPTMETILQQLLKLKEKLKSVKPKQSSTVPRQKPKRPAPAKPPGKPGKQKVTKAASTEIKKSSPEQNLSKKKEPEEAVSTTDNNLKSITEDTDVLPQQGSENVVRVNPLFVDVKVTQDEGQADAVELNEAPKEPPKVTEDEKITENVGLEFPSPPPLLDDNDSDDEDTMLSLPPPPGDESDAESLPPPPPPCDEIASDADDTSLPAPPEERHEDSDSMKTNDSQKGSSTDENDDLSVPSISPSLEDEDSNDESGRLPVITTPPPADFEPEETLPLPDDDEDDDFLAEPDVPPPMTDEDEKDEDGEDEEKNEDEKKQEPVKKPLFEEEEEEEEEKEEDDDQYSVGEGEGATTFSFTPNDDLDDGWEEFDPDQLPSYANYPNEPEKMEDDDDIPSSSMLTDEEAKMIW